METPSHQQLTTHGHIPQADYEEHLQELRKIYLTRLEETQARSDHRLEEIEQNYATRLKEAQAQLAYLRNSLQLRINAAANQPQAELVRLKESVEWQSSTIQSLRQELNALKATRSVRLAYSATVLKRVVVQAAKSFFSNPIQGGLDIPGDHAALEIGQELEVAGWVTSRTGWVREVEVWLDNQKLGEATYGLPRPDVLERLPLLFSADCGYRGHFRLEPGEFEPGPHILAVHVHTSEGKMRDFTCPVNLQVTLETKPAEKALPPSTTEAGWDLKISPSRGTVLDTVRIYTASRGNYFMYEIARIFEEGFKLNGLTTTLLVDEVPSATPGSNEIHLIVAPHEFYLLFLEEKCTPEEIEEINRGVYILNVEQPGTPFFELTYKWATRVRGTWDISRYGVEEFTRRNITSVYAPLGYTSFMELPANQQPLTRPVDIAFLGTSTPRRDQFFARHADFFSRFNCQFGMVKFEKPQALNSPGFYGGDKRAELYSRSKILLNVHAYEHSYFEWYRIMTALANRCLVISETSLHYEPLHINRHFVMSDLKDIPGACRFYLENEEDRLRITEDAYQFIIKNLSAERICKQLLGPYQEQ